MKILFIITGLGLGGAERQLVDLADFMSNLNHEVTIFYMTGRSVVVPKNTQVKLIEINADKTLFGIIKILSSLRKIIKIYRPDVVHSHMFHANIVSRLVRLSIRIPKLICTAHSSNEGGQLRMLAYRLTDYLADINTNVSESAVSEFENKGAVMKGRMIPVFNGIDTNKFRPNKISREIIRENKNISEEDKVILAAGRLEEPKDYPNLLNAFCNVSKVNNSCFLWIIGDGSMRSILIKEAYKLGISNRVCFLGAQTNVEDWFNAADIFVLSSAWEGFGLVVAEAMACEKLCVATDSGGVREVMGEFGFLIPPKNSEALAQGILSALALDEKSRGYLEMNSRKRIVEHFSIENISQKWIAIYQSEDRLRKK
jgi:glycosyltransferase involved in cell wall biosynthesis